MGVYEDAAAFQAAIKNPDAEGRITDRNGGKYKVVEGGLVFLQSDLLAQVRAAGDGYEDNSISFSSNDYFFLAVDYYLPDKTRRGQNLEQKPLEGTYAGEAIQYVVSRKGGAFGSDLNAENIGNGDMLCWTDMGPNSQGMQLSYLSYTETGDRYRGEPDFTLLTEKDKKKLADRLRERGMTDEGLIAEAVDSWLEKQTEYQDILLLADKDGDGRLIEEEYNEYFHWAVAAKPGGLRVGDMFQNMQRKSENTTNTATNFYVPTVSHNARIGDIVINNYLGNNGRLYVEDSHLYVGKLIDIPEDDPNRETLLKTRFEYQVYVHGYTGPMDAVVLRWNRLGNSGEGTWQRQMSTIDAMTSNEGFLLDSDKTTPSVMGKVGDEYVHLKAYTGNGSPEYYRYEDIDTNGQPIEGKDPVASSTKLYYIYVGGTEDEDDSSEHVKRLFQNTAGDTPIENTGVNHAGRTVYMTQEDYDALAGKNSTEPGTYWSVYEPTEDRQETGAMDYWFKEAYLIPVEEVTSAMATAGGDGPAVISDYDISLLALDASGWTFQEDNRSYVHLGFVKEGDTFRYDSSNYETVKKYLRIAHLTQNVDSTDVTITSEYALKSEYMTRTVYFGNLTEEEVKNGVVTGTGQGAQLTSLFDGRQVTVSGNPLLPDTKYTAQFTLGHEEGLLFPGLDSNSIYRVTEKKQAGFALEKATHRQENSQTVYEPDETNSTTGAKAIDGNRSANTAYFKDGKYSLDGNTAATKEEGAWYVNRYDPGTLSITKVLEAGEGGEITEEEKDRSFDFTLTLTAPENPAGMTAKGPFTYTITEGEGAEKKEIKNGRLLPKSMEGEKTSDDDIVTSDDGAEGGVWKFQLQGGQTMKVEGVPVQSGYTYEISEKIFGGYEVSDSEDGTDENGEHTVTGVVKAGQEEPVEVTFTNTRKYNPGRFSIVKELKDWTGGKPTVEDLKQVFDFSLRLTWPDSDLPLESDSITYTITDADGRTVQKGYLLPHDSEGKSEDGDKDIFAGEDKTWEFHLQGGWTMTVEGLPVGSGYSYTVSEKNLKFYTPSCATKKGEEAEGYYTVTGKVESGHKEPEEVKFINTQVKPEPAEFGLKLTKTLNDESSGGGDLKITKGEYSFVVTPDGSNPKDDPITKQTGWSDGVKGALVVKNGEPEPDGKTAEATIFEKMEYQNPGTYVYTVAEQISTTPGVSSDVSVYTVTVVVSKVYDGDAYQGKLQVGYTVTKAGDSAGGSGSEDRITFTNVYRENSVEVPLRVRKVYDGELKEGEFTFELTGVEFKPEGNVLPARNAEEQMKSVADGQTLEKDSETGEAQGDLEEEKKPGEADETVSSEEEMKPGAGTDSEEETKPGAETKPEEETKPGTETKPEEETKPGTETKPEEETKPGAGTDSEDGTKPEAETKPEKETNPEAETKSEGETNPKTETGPVTETRSETETQSGTGQQGTAGLAALRQGQKFAGSIMLSAGALIFRITALRREGQTASVMALGSRQTAIPVWTSGEWRTAVPFRILGEQRITVPTAASEEQRDSAASASQEEQQPPSTSAPKEEQQSPSTSVPKEEQQPPAPSAPKEDENQTGTGQEETAGDKEKEETGNNPGDTQTEETKGIPEPGSDSQGQGETEASPGDELPSGRHETEGTQKPESQPTDGTDTSPEDELPPDRQETQDSAAEGNTESVAEKKAGSEEKKERPGEVSGMLGDELMLIADMPGPDDEEGVPDGEEHPTWQRSNGEDGWVDFGTLEFKQPGTYTYELREVKEENSHIVYSSDIYQIIIKIGGSGTVEGPLRVDSVTYKKKQNDTGTWQTWDGEILVFVNELKTGGLRVEKTVTGSGGDKERVFNFTVDFDFSETERPKDVTISKNGEPAVGLQLDGDRLEFTLKDTEYVEVEGLPVGTTYTVTEAEANQDGYTTTVTTGEVSASGYAAAASKAKAGAGEIDAIPEETESGGDEAVTIPAEFEADGDEIVTIPAEFKADGDEIVTVPEETEAGEDEVITVPEETEAGEDEVITIPEENEVSALSADETAIVEATGEIKDGKQAVKFVNDRHIGNLTVAKTVTGTGGDTEKEWNFRVELSDTAINGQYGDMLFTDGVAEFTLKSGQSATAKDLLSGLTYTVTEQEANQDGYETLPSGESGTIPDGTTAEAKFVNRKEPPPPDEHKGNLTVTKTVTGTGGDKEKSWNFRVELSDKTINGRYGDMVFANGAAEFTLKSGQSATALNLPPGLTYTVTEAEANQGGYVTSSDGASGTIPDGDTAKASFSNRKDTPPPPPPPPPSDEHHGNLTVTKTVTGIDGDLNREWHFRVELSSRGINGQYGDMYFTNGVAEFTLKSGQSATALNLPPGITYTVTEAEANQDGYGTSASGASGTVPNGGTAKAGFVNSKGTPPPDNPPGSPGNPPGGPGGPPDIPGSPPDIPGSPPNTPFWPGNPPDTPQTGDNSHFGLWLSLMIFSLIGVAAMSVPVFGKGRFGKRRRRK